MRHQMARPGAIGKAINHATDNRQPTTENRKPKTDNRQPLFVLRLNSEEAYPHESDSTNFFQSWRRWRRVLYSRIRPAAGLRPIAGAQNLPHDRNSFHVP